MSDKEWYAHEENYGTIQEKSLVRFIHSYIDDIKKTYSDVYLIRNERNFKIYSFNKGLAFEPDFVMFLIDEDGVNTFTYQLFIEPKGEHLIGNDDSNVKSEFLAEIESKYEIHVTYENKDFKLVGLPFYNDAVNVDNFKEKFVEVTRLK